MRIGGFRKQQQAILTICLIHHPKLNFKMKKKSLISSRSAIYLFVLALFPVYACTDQASSVKPQTNLSLSEVQTKFSLSPEKTQLLRMTKEVIETHLNNERGKSSLGNRRELLNSESFMLDVASRINSEEFTFTPIQTANWNEPVFDNQFGLDTEYEFTVDDLSVPVRNHLNQFTNRLDVIANQHEDGLMTEEQAIELVKAECKLAGNNAFTNSAFTEMERNAMAEVFYLTEELSLPLANYVEEYALANGLAERGFFRRLGRAFLRVVVAVAVTAAIIAVPVAAVVGVKALAGATIKIGAVKGFGSIMKASVIKGKIGGIKTYSPILSGMYAGIKNAEKNWDKPWQGLPEFTFGYKVKL